MTFTELRKDLQPQYKQMTKAEFVNFCTASDGRVRVGLSKGKGRLTAKQALALLGVSP
jgi:hypothetical protein